MRTNRVHFTMAGLALLAISVLASTALPAVAAQQGRDLTPELNAGHAKHTKHPVEAGMPVRVELLPIGSSVLSIGSRIGFRVASNRSGYGNLYIANASGKVTLLVENLPLSAGQPVDLPKGGIGIRATPPTGNNRVVFLATLDRFPGFAGGSTTIAPMDIQVPASRLNSYLTTRLSMQPRNRWGLTSTIVRVTE